MAWYNTVSENSRETSAEWQMTDCRCKFISDVIDNKYNPVLKAWRNTFSGNYTEMGVEWQMTVPSRVCFRCLFQMIGIIILRFGTYLSSLVLSHLVSVSV